MVSQSPLGIKIIKQKQLILFTTFNLNAVTSLHYLTIHYQPNRYVDFFQVGGCGNVMDNTSN